MPVNNKEGANLLFIMPFVNHTTMLYYKDGKKEIYNDTVKKFLLKQVHSTSLVSPIVLQGQLFIATCSPRNPHCAWVNTNIIREHNLYQLCLQVQQYDVEINVEKVIRTYLKILKRLTI